MGATIKPIAEASVPELARKLMLARANPDDPARPCGRAVFWIGAGASISAGIPSGRDLAGRLARHIAKSYHLLDPQTLRQANGDEDEAALRALQAKSLISEKSDLGSAYGELFGMLEPNQERDFIRSVIAETGKRRINWAHLALGELVRQRMVHTLLTTNFDDLLLDGLVRCDQLPAIIDGVESLNRLDPRPPVPQLVYLHGSQHTYNPRSSTAAVGETKDIFEAQAGLYRLLRECSVLIVLGYAGNPGEGVMEMLLSFAKALPEMTVFWASYGHHDNLSSCARALLSTGRNKWLIPGSDADLFLHELLKETHVGVPGWFQQPVQHWVTLSDRISVTVVAEGESLREEVSDFRSRLVELEPFWHATGQRAKERRELRQLAAAGDHLAVWRRLKDGVLLDEPLLRLRANAAYEVGSRRLDDSLGVAASDWEKLIDALAPQSAAWADAQDRLGVVLATQGTQESLQMAITAFRAALAVRTRSTTPTHWAKTRNHLGNALVYLGHKSKDWRALREALVEYVHARRVFTRRSSPHDWGAIQINRGNALTLLGEHERNARLLNQAIAAHRAALSIFSESESATQLWATASYGLGNALAILEELGPTGNVTLLNEALDAYDQALTCNTPVKNRTGFANAQHAIGEVQERLYAISRETMHLQKALVAFSAAAQVWTAQTDLAGHQRVEPKLERVRQLLKILGE